MVRRRIAEQPVSRLAIWARRVALFSFAATLVAVIIVRSGALDIVPALATLAGSLLLAVVAIVLALAAGVAIWIDGVGGLRQAIAALVIGFALIAYPIYLGVMAYRLPEIYDVTTDPIDPPRFGAIARLRPRDAHLTTYQGLYAAELQHAAYADIDHEDTTASPLHAYNVALNIIGKRKWHIVDARPPQEAAGRDGIIEAVAYTLVLAFPEDVVVRVRPTQDGARIDVRSASRYGPHDFGANAARVRALIDDIDDILSAPEPEKKQPAAKSAQAAGKGGSAKR